MVFLNNIHFIFSNIFHKLKYMGRDELIEKTQCLWPCSFMDYQVSKNLKLISEDLLISLKVIGEPLIIPYKDKGTILVPRFATASVQVLTEVEAFSFGSLVADCGGVLGLFLGFNFLMIWDCVVMIVEKIQHKKSLNILE